jgi:phospholipid/cholesterol/gamma-HCH transport system substrate-binding protein
MRSRTLREGSVGLLILLGVGLFGGLVLWLRGISPGNRSYRIEVELQDASGIEVGSAVRYRGVKVGTITALRTDTDHVWVTVTISPATLVIPRQSIIETTQSGFIGQVFLDFRPPDTQLMAQASSLSPFQPSCNPELILCDGDRVSGKLGANFDALIRSTTEIAELLNQSKLIESASTTLATANTTLGNANTTLNRFERTAADLSIAARSINQLALDAKGQLRQLEGLGTATTAVTTAANQVTSLVQTNQGSIRTSLTNLNAAGQDLRGAINDLKPFISRLNQGKILANLELLADNGAAAAANLKSLSGTLNNPITILGLAQALDSARATFVNTQKITNDLQQVTGDATFRKNLLNLIRGLSRLVSSSQELEQHLVALQQSQVQPGVQVTLPATTLLPTLRLGQNTPQNIPSPRVNLTPAPVNLFTIPSAGESGLGNLELRVGNGGSAILPDAALGNGTPAPQPSPLNFLSSPQP